MLSPDQIRDYLLKRGPKTNTIQSCDRPEWIRSTVYLVQGPKRGMAVR